MSLMRRMRDITVATLNERLEQAEDPVKLIDQYLAAQREQIMQSEKVHRQLMVHAQSLRQQVTSAEQLRDKREQQALIALKAGEDHVAKMALQEKLLQEEKYEQFKELYDQSKHSIVELEEQLDQLKRDFDEVLSKRQYYMARLESVRLQKRMNESMQGSLGINGRTFHRLEERISDMELETRSLRDVRQMGRELAHAGGEMQQALERELSQLRTKLEKEGWLK
ncbi:PspA/IM30 family protein [Paenibacillus hemerocallicola]|jgi:phage shock protein A|uniref:PspA/IM30 family protein n=1 Tax=Paenibacillus hemerocallicola TaxID=1172614 RepID=A0A5C4T696_9BACL|nr:PspA/IM30 family protein [Paenibacillus hemerocallicola]TNJ64578.1 PspA/IM30 family protein [Paenibacillus hemerocallicola]